MKKVISPLGLMASARILSILVITEEGERVFPWKKSLTWLKEAISHSLERRKK
jgi:hypothetical protein